MLGVERKIGKTEHRALVRGVGSSPRGVRLGFAQRFGQRPLDPSDVGFQRGTPGWALKQLDRPGPYEHLIEEVFIVSIRRRIAVCIAAAGAQDPAPRFY